jgi:tRNA(Ile)-lysidine synthase
MLEKRITQALIKDCGVNPDLPLVVGVSGGADSLCLVHCLRESGFKLIVGHLDHSLRERSAAQAQALCQRVAEWELPFYSQREDVGQFALQNKLGIEEAARFCRYRFLFKLAREHGAQGVVVGHHADDQVETVLMHFLRGSGLSGLSGMQPRSLLGVIDPGLPLFRPMLAIHRQEIQEYCQAHGLEVLEDESNTDPSFFRNRLRHELIPQLEETNPGFRQALVRTAITLSADRQLLESLADEAFKRALLRAVEGGLVFSREIFLGLHLSLQRLVLRQAFTKLLPDTRDLGFEAVERALAAISSIASQTPLSGGLWIFCFESDFVIAPRSYQHQHADFPQLSDTSGSKLKRGGRLALNAGWSLAAELIDDRKFKALPEALKTHPLHAWLNPLDIEWPLEVRPMRTGERWSPLGMALKHQKLSDFFVNQKIPQSARARWPVVLSGGSVLWVAGLRIAQAWRLLGDEREILHLQLHMPDELIDPVKLK